MCGLRTRPLADADPQYFLDPRTDSGPLVDKQLRIWTTRILYLGDFLLITADIFNFETMNNLDFVSAVNFYLYVSC